MLANFGVWNRRQLLMKNRFAVALAGALMLAALVPASAASHINERDHIRHVLLISVDGLHALDVANFVQSHPNSALAELSGHGVTYSNAHAITLGFFPRPSCARDRRVTDQPRLVLRRELRSDHLRSHQHHVHGFSREHDGV